MTLDRLSRALVTGLLLAPISCSAQDDPPGPAIGGPAVDSLIAVLETELPGLLDEQGLPGASVVIVDARGEVWSAAFGTTVRAGDRSVDDQTIFSVQSMSKAVTCAKTSTLR